MYQILTDLWPVDTKVGVAGQFANPSEPTEVLVHVVLNLFEEIRSCCHCWYILHLRSCHISRVTMENTTHGILRNIKSTAPSWPEGRKRSPSRSPSWWVTSWTTGWTRRVLLCEKSLKTCCHIRFIHCGQFGTCSLINLTKMRALF